MGDAYDRSDLWLNASAGGYHVDGMVAGSLAATSALADLRDLLRDSAPNTMIKMTVRSGTRLSEISLRLRDQI